MVEPVYCVHCGAVAKHPVYKTIHGQYLAFCCGGCVQVYEMLQEEAGSSQDRLSQPPLQPASVKTTDSGLSKTVSFQVVGMTCANCVATVQRSLSSIAGVIEVSVVLETERATMKTVAAGVSLKDVRRAVEKAGYAIISEEDKQR